MGLGFLGFDVAVVVGIAEGSAVGEMSGGGGVISGAEAVGLGSSMGEGETVGLGTGSIAVGAAVGAGGGGSGAGNVR